LLGLPLLAACQLLPSPPIALACDGPPGASGVPGYLEIDLERRTVYDGVTIYVDGADARDGAQIDIRIDAHSIAWQSANEHRVLWRSVLYRDTGSLFLQLPGGRASQAMCRPTSLRKTVL
jgi:hypothetical protein